MKENLVAAIEKKLDWGPSETWTNKDFEKLSESILTTTHKQLSVTTLKRIWGRAQSIAEPSVTTLDILAEFTGYENWRAFTKAYGKKPLKKKPLPSLLPVKAIYLIIGILCLGLVFGFIWHRSHNTVTTEKLYKPEDFKFTSRQISTDIPNSVVFEYDVSAAEKGANIEIQQSWDTRKRIQIDPKDSIATCIYYRPGYFRAKLVVNGMIVKEHDILIPAPDWLGVIERDTLPIYLQQEEYSKKHRLAVSESTLEAYAINPSISKTIIGLYLVKDFGDIHTNEFEFTANVKNDFDKGINACQSVRITILYEGGAISIPLANKGCVAQLSAMAFGQNVDGRKVDLSGLGVDFKNAASIRLIADKQQLNILVNNKQAFTFNVPEVPYKIVGIQIHFEGAGSVNQLELKNGERTAYKLPSEEQL